VGTGCELLTGTSKSHQAVLKILLELQTIMHVGINGQNEEIFLHGVHCVGRGTGEISPKMVSAGQAASCSFPDEVKVGFRFRAFTSLWLAL
jgi:hypothetical protein